MFMKSIFSRETSKNKWTSGEVYCRWLCLAPPTCYLYAFNILTLYDLPVDDPTVRRWSLDLLRKASCETRERWSGNPPGCPPNSFGFHVLLSTSTLLHVHTSPPPFGETQPWCRQQIVTSVRANFVFTCLTWHLSYGEGSVLGRSLLLVRRRFFEW